MRLTRGIWVTISMLAVVMTLAFAGTGVALADAPKTELKGVITAIDKTATPLPTVTVKPAEGGSAVIVKVDSSTAITKSGIGKATINDLAINDRVEVSYSTDTMIASRITASPPLSKHHAYEGTIKSKGTDSFVLTNGKKPDVPITVNSQTKYHVPGVDNPTFADFSVGDKVAVLGVESSGGIVALHVNLIPSKPLHIQRVGMIDAYTAGTSISLKDKKGDVSTFTITTDTKIVLKKGATAVTVGERATVVARRVPSSDTYTATAIVVFGSGK